MSCPPFDLRDYVLNELGDPERRLVETHVKTCGACREELDRLRVTETALLSLPDEEIPQRIGFVSDPVFEPSRLSRWGKAFWGSAARVAFASAAMLSAAIVYSAATRPGTAPAPDRVDLAAVEARFNQRVEKAVQQAVEIATAQEQRRTAELLAQAEERHTIELNSIRFAVEQTLSVMERRQMQLMYRASADGAPPYGASR